MSLTEEGTAATAKEGRDFDNLGKHMSINEHNEDGSFDPDDE